MPLGALIWAYLLPNWHTNIKGPYQSSWTPHSTKQVSWDQEFSWELIDSSVDQTVSFNRKLLSELIDSPTDHLTFCDQKFLLEPINSPIDQPTSCKRVLLSELRNSQRYFNWICFAFVYKEGPILRYFCKRTTSAIYSFKHFWLYFTKSLSPWFS